MTQEWRDIVVEGTLLKVSDDGHVKTWNGKNRKRYKSNTGYWMIYFKNGEGRGRNIGVARLVGLAFIPNPENLATINHKNGVKTDNRVENLEWLSSSDNTRHAHKTGLRPKTEGEDHPMCRLKEADILEIRRMVSEGALHREAAARFGVCRRHVSYIMEGRKWGYLKKKTAA